MNQVGFHRRFRNKKLLCQGLIARTGGEFPQNFNFTLRKALLRLRSTLRQSRRHIRRQRALAFMGGDDGVE